MKLKKPIATLLTITPLLLTSAYGMTPEAQELNLLRAEHMNQLRFNKNFKLNASKLNLRKFQTNTKGTIFQNTTVFSQTPANWFNLDLDSDGFAGVSTNLVYQEFGEPTSAEDIIVAVIDSGVDVNHEDLQGKVWINENEIPNNGIDDDNNGYIDDVFGWNFIGAKDGIATIESDNSVDGIKLIQGDINKQVNADSLEITREYVRLKNLKTQLEARGETLTLTDTKKLMKIAEEVSQKQTSALDNLKYFEDNMKLYKTSEKVLKEEGGLAEITQDLVEQLNATTETLTLAKKNMLDLLNRGLSFDYMSGELEHYNASANFHYNPESDTRATIVMDNYSDPYEKGYGNNDVIGPDAFHGTHVAGIIAANRDNNIGIQGIAKNVKIMAIRAVPNGDERDKDVANAIIYAVDNGAKIINMSFGKDYSPYKTAVNRAVKYAQDRGVLLVHAAGNSSQNNDKAPNFPNKKLHGSVANNWLEVGASGFKADSSLAAGFSNYGKNSVDIFAPGTNINSTVPGSRYNVASGTSMASPVVSGVAALALSYNENLNSQEIKDVLISTSRHFPRLYVYKARLGKVLFSDLSIHGGIPNAVEAVRAVVDKKDNTKKRPLIGMIRR